jgi:signal transduction histidine kinase
LDDCDRVEELVANMLVLARAEQMADEGHRHQGQPVELVGSCEEAVAKMESLAQAKGVTIRSVTANGEVYVNSDDRDLQIVWTNLLQNAIQHSPSGAVVSMVMTSESNTASVRVEDSGTGIPQDQQPRIFERFFRGDRSRSRTTGRFGLGLPICKAIVDAYGGKIRVESSSAHGTCVTVTLPISAGAHSPNRPAWVQPSFSRQTPGQDV